MTPFHDHIVQRTILGRPVSRNSTWKSLPEDVIAKYDRKPKLLEPNMRYMGSDWSASDNCMTFTFSVLASAAAKISNEKSCTKKERQQAMAMVSLAHLSCWHIMPSQIKASLSHFAKQKN